MFKKRAREAQISRRAAVTGSPTIVRSESAGTSTGSMNLATVGTVYKKVASNKGPSALLRSARVFLEPKHKVPPVPRIRKMSRTLCHKMS